MIQFPGPRGRGRMRLIICLSLLATISLNSAAVRAEDSSLDKSTLQSLCSLEKRYFGHTFDSDSDESRTGRLEQLVFGEQGSGSYVDRIANLVKATPQEETSTAGGGTNNPGENKKNKNRTAQPLAKENLSSNDVGQDKPDASTQEDYPHVNALEKAILGEVHANEELPARLSRLEQTAFGAASQSPDFVQRTDALDNYATKKLHKNVAQTPDYDSPKMPAGAAPGAGMNKQKVLATVANTVFGMAGFGAMAMGPKIGPLSGFSGVHFSQRQANPNAPDTSIPEEVDPTISSSLPPPIEAKLITKVSWCEYKVFGRTFLNMHLTDRLRQLSQQLQYDTSKSDLELMDDIGAIMKLVQAQVKSKPISSNGSADPGPGSTF